MLFSYSIMLKHKTCLKCKESISSWEMEDLVMAGHGQSVNTDHCTVKEKDTFVTVLNIEELSVTTIKCINSNI